MAIQDNSPTRTNIRWSNVKLLHDGMIYVIKDGYTSNKYVYWKPETPNEFFTCDILPDSHIQTVMMNNEGVAYLYPSVSLLIDNNNQQKADNTVLINHISNQSVHMSVEEKAKIVKLEEVDTALFEQIDLLARRMYDFKLKIDAVEDKNAAQDRTIAFLEESLEALYKRVEELEKPPAPTT